MKKTTNGQQTSILRDQLIAVTSVDIKDARFQVRQSLDAAKIKEYEIIARQQIRLNGFVTRPVLWKRGDGRYAICDGCYRIQAAINAGLTEFHANVVQGTEAEAMVLAMRANLSHGIPLASSERVDACYRTVVAMTQDDGTQPSHQVVADALGVCEKTIRDYRDELAKANKLPLPQKVKGKDGKVQAATKSSRVPKTGTNTAVASAPTANVPASADSSSPDAVRAAVNPAGMSTTSPASAGGTSVSRTVPATDREVLVQSLGVLKRLDVNAWQACSNQAELIGLVTELVKVGQAALAVERSQRAAAA